MNNVKLIKLWVCPDCGADFGNKAQAMKHLCQGKERYS